MSAVSRASGASQPGLPPPDFGTPGNLVVELPPAALEALAAALVPAVADELERRQRAREAPASPYLTIPEAADYLRCSRQRVDNLLSARSLTRVKDGSRTLVRREEVERYLRAKR